MPLTAAGSKVKNAMIHEYGSKEKGERVFYATANKHPETGKKWHAVTRGTGKSRKMSGARGSTRSPSRSR